MAREMIYEKTRREEEKKQNVTSTAFPISCLLKGKITTIMPSIMVRGIEAIRRTVSFRMVGQTLMVEDLRDDCWRSINNVNNNNEQRARNNNDGDGGQ